MRLRVGAATVIVGLCALLGGCQTGVPQAENFPNQRQFIMMSAAQWQVLANWTVAQFTPSLPANRRINVHSPGDSPFSKCFAQFLATALVQKGYVVGPGDGVPTLHFTVDVVDHGHGPTAGPLTFTMIGSMAGAVAWIAYEGGSNVVAPPAVPAIGAATGALIDAQRAFFPQPTDAEIAITSSLSSGGQRYAGRSDVFYISGSDRDDYYTPYSVDSDLLASDNNR